ncbi:MAG TPA: transcription-repair coupling factor, partial [Rhodanobacteraceae bacterium]|nr:transcription-repair coupling factor [Rhodanobacteraceae bacterium]
MPAPPHRRAWWVTPPGGALALSVAEAARAHPGLTVMATRDTLRANQLEEELRVFAGDLPVLQFPDWETLPYDLYSPHPEIISQRIATLYRLPAVGHAVLVVPISSLLQRLAPRSYITGSGLAVKRGQSLVLDAEQRRLQAAGYRHVPQVGEPGDFAVRGALIDIFPMGAPEPYRIELLDEEVETIRSFDPETQLSKESVAEVSLLPAREFPLNDEATKAFRQRLRERFPIDVRHCPLYQDLKQGVTPAGIEYYLPLFFERTETLFDYLGDGTLIVLGDGALDAADAFWAQTGERHDQRSHDIQRPILPPGELYLTPEALRAELNTRPVAEFVTADRKHAVALGATAPPMLPLAAVGNAAPAAALRAYRDDYPGKLLLVADSAGRREVLAERLHAAGLAATAVADWPAFMQLPAPALALTAAPLEQGFCLDHPAITVLTERELLGERVRQRQRRRRGAVSDPETIIRDLTELAIGAPIVHLDHGVGRYQGLLSMDVGGQKDEFLAIEYAKGAKLYVPVAQLGLVSRYTGSAPELAPLHSLGGDAWERAKRKAAEKVRDVAAELLAIHAERAARKGSSIAADAALYNDFAARFPFEETPDQEQAIDAVLADLAAPQPMDRVVCGDVGFGKTEVALRAAFVAASAGRQVALLVPTTLLAQQHYQNFADRLADWPLKVDVLSRFKSKKETEEALKRLAEGKIDIMVGTHKLLQADVKFKQLGLVIVDEEHRFGVRQKEQLKKLRAEVDLLTLTATPIPRTLNMAMGGLRDLSIIATPPAHRMAVKTLIAQYDPALLREAMQRELARGGQVYFLHNDVASIERCAHDLETLMPEARIRVAHGQMPERELERVMLDFHHQRFNVLVCSTIIESGIDIPSANTIIIDRADRFG